LSEFPEYMCGGAQKRTRPTALRRRRKNRPNVVEPSLHTGRQTAKKRKAGSRVTGQYAFTGDGKALNEDVDEDQKKKGIGFGKQAASKRAREERALAAERRSKVLQSRTPSSLTDQASEDADSATESDDSDNDRIVETDQDRRRAMLDASQDVDLDSMKYDFPDDFEFNLPNPGSTQGVCDLSTSRFTFTSAGPSNGKGKDKVSHRNEGTSYPSKRIKTVNESSSIKKKVTATFGLDNMVQDEVRLRQKESIGLALTGNQKLGGSGSGRIARCDEGKARGGIEHETERWECLVCTLINKPSHLACSACTTPRGESGVGR